MTTNAPSPGAGGAARSRSHHPEARGLLPGTLVLTRDGEIPVEFLAPGDDVITRDAGLVPVEAIRRVTLTLPALRFAAGALGQTRPQSDLILPAGQPVLVRDWRAQALFGRARAIVPAAALIDGQFVRDLGLCDMILHQLQFPAPHVIYAGGMELGCGDRPLARQAA